MKTAFKVKQKTFFIIFKALSVAKNCLRPESAPLNQLREEVNFNLLNKSVELYKLP